MNFRVPKLASNLIAGLVLTFFVGGLVLTCISTEADETLLLQNEGKVLSHPNTGTILVLRRKDFKRGTVLLRATSKKPV